MMTQATTTIEHRPTPEIARWLASQYEANAASYPKHADTYLEMARRYRALDSGKEDTSMTQATTDTNRHDEIIVARNRYRMTVRAMTVARSWYIATGTEEAYQQYDMTLIDNNRAWSELWRLTSCISPVETAAR